MRTTLTKHLIRNKQKNAEIALAYHQRPKSLQILVVTSEKKFYFCTLK